VSALQLKEIEETKPLLIKLIDYLVTYPPDPLPLVKGRGSVGKRGAKPLSKISSPSPLKEKIKKGSFRGA